MTRWPEAVWTSAWLRGVDAPARQAIEAAGTVRSLAKGARLFGPGEPADAVFVVGEGLVDVKAVRRGETEARSLRRAVAGDTLGEEAIVRAGAVRAVEATCATAVVVAEVPAAVFRRAAGKTGSEAAGPLEAALRRAAGRDALRSSAIGHALSDRDVEVLAAVAEVRSLARDEVLFAAGDPASLAYLVADGMVQVRDGEAVPPAPGAPRAKRGDGKTRVRAYLSRGDLVADGTLEAGGAHDVTVAACGPAWVLAVPRAELVRVLRRSPAVLERAGRLARSAPLPEATRHVLGDLWRFATAGSMLVIDDEACVRCGACAAGCASVHGDGVSRLVRRGEKVAVKDANDGSMRALLIPGSCQHCKHPACMIDCPTGAIGRDPAGSVFVREDLCVGCGRCESACPWGAVQMAPRAAETRRRLPVVVSAEVAVKCDLCADLAAGPACVSACPVDAIARIEPVAAISEVRRAVGAHVPRQALPRTRAGWPWIAGAVALASGLVLASAGLHAMRMATGVASGLLVAALVAYAALKRARLGPSTPGVSQVRVHAITHQALGLLAVGVVVAHVGARVAPNAAGALLLAFVVASATGIAGAIAYRLVPRALSRVERRALLREDLAARARDLDDRAFGALTGRSEAMKAVYARWLAPHARSPLGALALVARRTTLREEERTLRDRVERVLGARTATLDGLDDLVRLVVERRALRAQMLLQWLLQGWLPLHVVAVAVTAALLVLHVVLVTRGR